MITLNGDLLCAIDTETTGLRAGFHEVIEFAVLPLGMDLKPNSNIPSFSMLIRPDSFENISTGAMTVNQIKINDLVAAPCREDALGAFEAWFDEFIKGNNFRQIKVLAQNWAFDSAFLKEFFGWYEGKSNMDDFMNLRKGVRDTYTTACYINDLAEYNGNKVPFPKVNLAYLCSQLNIERDSAHRALSDCYDTAEVYRRMTSMYLQGVPIGFN